MDYQTANLAYNTLTNAYIEGDLEAFFEIIIGGLLVVAALF